MVFICERASVYCSPSIHIFGLKQKFANAHPTVSASEPLSEPPTFNATLSRFTSDL